MSTVKRIRAADITRALGKLNDLRGLKYPAVGHCRYEDVSSGLGSFRRIWVIINPVGGITRSDLNGPTMRETLENIESAIAQETKQ